MTAHRTQSAHRPAVAPGTGDRRQALVLSGGGAKGAYEIGVMRALFEGASPATGHRPITAEVYTGTSVGSYNAAYMVSHDLEGSDLEVLLRLEGVWRRRIAESSASCGNGIFRLRASPFDLVRPACWRRPLDTVLDLTRDASFFAGLFANESERFITSEEWLPNRLLRTIDLSALFDLTPYHRLLHQTLDCEGLGASPKELTVIVTDFHNGIPKEFTKRDLCGRYGWRPVVASSALPGLFPPTEIDGQPMVDGGMTMNTPLVPAILDGAEVLHVVFLDPRIRNLPMARPGSTLDTVYRMLSILMASNIHNNIFLIPTIYHQMERIQGLDPESEEYRAGLRRINHLWSPPLRVTEWPFRKVEIHKYLPSTDLGGAEGLLDFRLRHVENNIALGYDDTLRHDCEVAGCILPDTHYGDPR